MPLSSLDRLRFILTTIFLFGGKIVLHRLRLLYLVPLRLRVRSLLGRSDEQHLLAPEGERRISPPAVRKLLETLGPTFVKLGQILSLRPDVVGEEMSRELSRLQSDAPPFPFEKVRRIVEEELGSPLESNFSDFDEQPVAAASLAQVHHARLKDGTEVAVKVQRPDIRTTIEQDIHLLLYLARLAHRFMPEVRPYDPVRVVLEFADWTRRELNFVTEGHNAERFRFAFQGHPHIKIPVVYWEFTRKRVLAMEYIEGVRADDFSGIQEQGLDRQKLALYGVDAQLQQFLINGFFHADPHPGNSFVLEGNVLCFYDFGMVGYLDEKQRRELISCFIAFANRDIENFLRHFLHLTTVSEKSDVSGFRKDASAILSEMFFSPTNPSVAWIFFRLINRGAARRIGFPADLALFGKAIITTEAMGRVLYPDFDFNEHLAPFVKKAFEAYLDPMRFRHSLATDLIDYVAFLKGLPQYAQTALRRLDEKERVGPRLDPTDMAFLTKELKRQGDRRMAGIALMGLLLLFVIAGLSSTRTTAADYSILGAGMGLFLVLFLVFLVRAGRKER